MRALFRPTVHYGAIIELHTSSNFVACSENSDYSILAAYFEETQLKVIMLNSSAFEFRLWDFSQDCHTNLYENSTFPVGMDIEDQYGVGIAVYCPKVRRFIIKCPYTVRASL